MAATPRLVVVNRDPSPGETGVPVDATLVLQVVDTGADGVNRASVRVWVDGVLGFKFVDRDRLPVSVAPSLEPGHDTA